MIITVYSRAFNQAESNSWFHFCALIVGPLKYEAFSDDGLCLGLLSWVDFHR